MQFILRELFLEKRLQTVYKYYEILKTEIKTKKLKFKLDVFNEC